MRPLKKRKYLERGMRIVMAFLVVVSILCIMVSIGIKTFVGNWGDGVKNTVSVSVLYPQNMPAKTQRNITDKIVLLLEGKKGVKSVYKVSEKDKKDALSNWFANSITRNKIQLPLVWQLEVSDGFNISSMRQDMQAIYSGIMVDDYNQWKSSTLAFVDTIIGVIFIMVAICFGILGIFVSICIRAIVSAQMDTIQVLTLLGASDAFIIRDIGWYGLWLGVQSALYGVLISMGIGLVVYGVSMDMSSVFEPQNMLRILGVCAIIPTTAIISYISARHSAKVFIRQQYRI